MKKSTAILLLTISIFLIFLIFSGNMPFEAFLFTSFLFIGSMILYLITLFTEEKNPTD